MGRGGCDPQYFLYRMKWWEVKLYIEGLYERDRNAWVMNRRLIYWVLNGMGCKKDKAGTPISETDIYRIPSIDDIEEKESIPDDYEERMRALLNSCAEHNKSIEN